MAGVCPLLRKTFLNLTVMEKYWPVTNFRFSGQVVEWAVETQLKFLDEVDYLDPFQFYFQERFGATLWQSFRCFWPQSLSSSQDTTGSKGTRTLSPKIAEDCQTEALGRCCATHPRVLPGVTCACMFATPLIWRYWDLNG